MLRHFLNTHREKTTELSEYSKTSRVDAAILADDKLRDSIFHYCVNYLRSDHDAADAAQEIFVKALAAKNDLMHCKAWLFTVARNHCLNLLRERAIHASHAGNIFLHRDHKPLTTWSSLSRRSELRSRLFELLDQMPVKYAEALYLRYIADLSRIEVAKVLGVSISVVRSRLYEGLQQLRKHSSLLSLRQTKSGR
ncbi:MAG: sigma-70 family RNA polymerase sigma factor [Phycisphaerales bacterium]|nr:sigma-70 family RNA polymerase sigma factor [Phycisphaerales bacterium]